MVRELVVDAFSIFLSVNEIKEATAKEKWCDELVNPSNQSLSIFNDMSVAKTAYESLHRQLLINTKAAAKKQNAQDVKKRIALLSYQRINAIKDNQTEKVADINTKLADLKKQTEDPVVEVDSKLLEALKPTQETAHNVEHISDIANFLSYQRTYNELIERYNPGLSMTQEDKIRKTAHRVGFELPPDYAE